jgi:hypothetical protein
MNNASRLLVIAAAISQQGILSLRKDFDKLMQVYEGQRYSNLAEAQRGVLQIKKHIQIYLKSLQNLIERTVLVRPVSEFNEEVNKTYLTNARPQIAKLYKELDTEFSKIESPDVGFLFYLWAKDELSRDEYERLLETLNIKYPTDFSALRDFSKLDTYADAFNKKIDYYINNRFQEGTEPVKKAATKLFDALREYISKLGQGTKGKKVLEDEYQAPETFNFGGVTWVNDAYITEETFGRFIQNMKPYLERLKKLMPEVLYGEVYLRRDKGKDFEAGGKAWTEGAHYDPAKDAVRVFNGNLDGALLVHELAHRYWFKFMSGERLHRWEKFFQDVVSPTEYGQTSHWEDFAEVVTSYVMHKMGKPLPSSKLYKFDRATAERFESIVGRSLQASKQTR